MENEQPTNFWARVADHVQHAVAPVEQGQAKELTPEQKAAMRQDLGKTFELRK